MYKTGDLCRVLEDGNLEYLGRMDTQVKLRGFRIELGEIEAIMRNFDLVSDAAALIQSLQASPVLVGYLRVENPSSFPISEMRAYLESKLPSFMVPSFLIPMKEFPLTGSGKIDRIALPDPTASRTNLTSNYVAPRNFIESTLCGIWKSVLGLQQEVGINDNFFELGGDSIMSIQVVSRANQAGIGFTVKSIFTLKTISNLALQVGAVAQLNADQHLTGPTPLLPSIAWFVETQVQYIPNIHHFNQAEILKLPTGIKMLPPFDMKQILLRLVSHHDALRLSLEQHQDSNGLSWKLYFNSETHMGYEYVDLSNNFGKESTSDLASKAQKSLHLSRGPIVHAVHYHYGPSQPDEVLLVVHHIAIDGISWRILMEDFQHAVTLKLSNKIISFPNKTLSLRQWCTKWIEFIESSESKASLELWKKSLAITAPSLKNVHFDPLNTSNKVHRFKIQLSKTVTRKILTEVCPTFRAQINDILLACLAHAFSKVTKHPLFSFTLEGHGREDPFGIPQDVSRTVGWFTSIFPMTLHLPQNFENEESYLVDLVKSVKEQLRHIPHKGASFGYLKYHHLHSNGSPLLEETQLVESTRICSEILFNYLGKFDSSFDKVGPLVDPEAVFSRLIDINALVRNGLLEFDWVFADWIQFDPAVLDSDGSLNRLPLLVAQILETLVSQVDDSEKLILSTATPSDFELLPANVSQQELDQLILHSGHSSVDGLSYYQIMQSNWH